MNDLHLYLFGEIAPDSVNSLNPSGQPVVFGTNWLVSGLRSNPSADKIVLHINSPGGDVSEGFAMHDILSQFITPVEAIIEGRCASIATVVALAAPIRKITANSTWFIHNPWNEIEGDAATFRRAADELQAVEDVIAQFYAQKTGQDLAALEALMQSETEFDAAAAVTYGFATEVVPTVHAKALFNLTNNMSKEISLLDRVSNTLKALKNFGSAKAADFATKDGQTLQIDSPTGKVAVGDSVSLNGSPAPNADYVIAESGDTITVVDGKITAITPAAAPAVAEQPAAVVAPPVAAAQPAGGVTSEQFNTLLNSVADLAAEVKNMQTASNAKALEVHQVLAKQAETMELIGTTMGSAGFKKIVNRQTFSEDNDVQPQVKSAEEQKAAAIKAARERRTAQAQKKD